VLDATLLVLAGGASRRMGRPKALLPVAGTTLVAASPATITVTISAAPASPVIPASSPSPAPSG